VLLGAVPPSIRECPKEFANSFRIAAAVKWNEIGKTPSEVKIDNCINLVKFVNYESFNH
jgi:hypothetical protein